MRAAVDLDQGALQYSALMRRALVTLRRLPQDFPPVWQQHVRSRRLGTYELIAVLQTWARLIHQEWYPLHHLTAGDRAANPLAALTAQPHSTDPLRQLAWHLGIVDDAIPQGWGIGIWSLFHEWNYIEPDDAWDDPDKPEEVGLAPTPRAWYLSDETTQEPLTLFL